VFGYKLSRNIKLLCAWNSLKVLSLPLTGDIIH